MNPPPVPRPLRLQLDAHVHIYPFHNLPRLLLGALSRMPRLAPADQRVLCLAERTGYSFFQALAQDEISLPSDWRILAWDPDGGVKIRHRPTHRDLWILAGRQMATAENIEICSLFSDAPIPDGLPARDTLLAIEQAGGLPALDWAFGKWTFARGRLVRALCAEFPPPRLALIDTAMRPRGFPPPRLFATASRAGRLLLAGSDPLPCANEEDTPGRCYTTLILPPPDDSTRLVAHLRRTLRAVPPPPLTPHGRHDTLLQALRRRRAPIISLPQSPLCGVSETP